MSKSSTKQSENRSKTDGLVVAVSNQKGGSGKTTTTLHVAGALNQLGIDNLVVDLDPQGHLSEDAGYGELYDVDDTNLHDILVDLEQNHRINDVVRGHDEFDIVPAHVDMFKTESDLNNEVRREERLKLAINQVDRSYGVILIDCPPNLGSLTNNALVAAENILIPARPATKSIKAIELLLDQRNALSDAYDINIPILGVVANEVSYDNESKEMMQWFEDTFPDHVPVFEIRSRVALQRAADNFSSIYTHDEDCDMEAEYLRIAEHLEEVRKNG